MRLILLLFPLLASIHACASATPPESPQARPQHDGVRHATVSGRQAGLILQAIAQTIQEREPNARVEDFTATIAEKGGVTTIYLARVLEPVVEGGVPPSPALYTVVVEPGGMTVFSGIGD